MTGESGRISKLVLVPGLITLAVTLLRLVGEFQNWSPALFSRAGGGGLALVGIAWLPPVFGAWFAARLASSHDRPSPGRLSATGLLGLVLSFGGSMLVMITLRPPVLVRLSIFLLLALVGGWLAYRAWPTLGRVLLAYGVAARVPVVVVMLLAILGNWGTHYDAGPPELASMAAWPRWLLIGVVPQLLLWVPFTLYTGALGGGVGLWWAGRNSTRTV
jgi:hypothetical protein